MGLRGEVDNKRIKPHYVRLVPLRVAAERKSHSALCDFRSLILQKHYIDINDLSPPWGVWGWKKIEDYALRQPADRVILSGVTAQRKSLAALCIYTKSYHLGTPLCEAERGWGWVRWSKRITLPAVAWSSRITAQVKIPAVAFGVCRVFLFLSLAICRYIACNVPTCSV